MLVRFCRRLESYAPSINAFLFALTLAGAIASGLLLFVSSNLTDEQPTSDSAYYFLRAAARTNDLLRVSMGTAISPTEVARRESWEKAGTGVELLVLISVLAITAILLVLLRKFVEGRLQRRFYTIGFGLAVFFATPLAYVIVTAITWKSPLPFRQSTQSGLTWVLAAEVIFAIVILCRKKRLSTTTLSALFFINSAFWIYALWSAPMVLAITVGRLLVPGMLLWLFPVCGTAWLLSLRGDCAQAAPTLRGTWMWAFAILSSAVALFVWAPRPSHGFPVLPDSGSSVKFVRGPCFGSCASYELTIHGDGSIEYLGRSSVRIHGTRSGKIDGASVERIWSLLERVHFTSLDDRAFRWCFDTPSLSVSASTVRQSKTVSSDAFCVGSKTGVQARFVEATYEIDKIVDSDQWVRCDGRCRY